jgi:hypothetical protein
MTAIPPPPANLMTGLLMQPRTPKDWFGIVEDVDENSQDDGNAMNF